MKISVALIALSICCPLAAFGQQKPMPPQGESANASLDAPLSLGELTPTPDMWFYEQEMKNYMNPKLAVRRKAEYRAAQRQLRLAAQKWYGADNQRPTATSTPFQGGTYAPSYGGGRDPNRWSGRSSPTIVLQSKRDNYRGVW